MKDLERAAERPAPKFKVGQVVVIKNVKKTLPFRILGLAWSDGMWFYQWNRNNYASESSIRELTLEEMGRS